MPPGCVRSDSACGIRPSWHGPPRCGLRGQVRRYAAARLRAQRASSSWLAARRSRSRFRGRLAQRHRSLAQTMPVLPLNPAWAVQGAAPARERVPALPVVVPPLPQARGLLQTPASGHGGVALTQAVHCRQSACRSPRQEMRKRRLALAVEPKVGSNPWAAKRARLGRAQPLQASLHSVGAPAPWPRAATASGRRLHRAGKGGRRRGLGVGQPAVGSSVVRYPDPPGRLLAWGLQNPRFLQLAWRHPPAHAG